MACQGVVQDGTRTSEQALMNVIQETRKEPAETRLVKGIGKEKNVVAGAEWNGMTEYESAKAHLPLSGSSFQGLQVA